MEHLQIYIQMIKRGWWLIALSALAALNMALISSYNATPRFRTKASFIVSPGPSILAGQDKEVINSIEALDKRSIVSTYAEVLKSDAIFDQAAADIGFGENELSSYTVTAVVLPDASVLELTVEGSNPNIAAQLTNQIGTLSIEYIEELYLVYNINRLDQATPPSNPFSPQPIQDSAVAFILGAGFGAMLAILREFTSTPFNNWRRRLLKDKNSLAQKRRVVLNHLKGLIADSGTEYITFCLLQIGTEEGIDMLSTAGQKQLLRQTTAVLQNELRGKDVIGRWSNNQFALLIPELNEQAALEKLEALVEKLQTPMQIDELPNPLSLLITSGMASWKEDGSASVLVEEADKALIDAKKEGATVLLYNAPLTAQTVSANDSIQSHLSATPTD